MTDTRFTEADGGITHRAIHRAAQLVAEAAASLEEDLNDVEGSSDAAPLRDQALSLVNELHMSVNKLLGLLPEEWRAL